MLRILQCVLIVTLLGVGPTAAQADPVICEKVDPRTGQCVIVADPEPDPGVPVDPIGDGGGGGGAQPVCMFGDIEVPCQSPLGVWSNARSCYVALMDPQPPKDHLAWGGREDGAIYVCHYHPAYPSPDGLDFTPFWLPAPPEPGGGGVPPEVLAQQAVTSMGLKAIDIGIVPEPGPDSVGLVGMPTWMWVDQPSESTWGPITRSASAGGITVTATAEVDRVEWDMGDGSSVTCSNAGTPYADSYGKQSSPTCGHTYTKTGRYTVEATSYWVVTWSGAGQSGTIPLNFTGSAPVTMGEVQVITQ